MAVPKRRVSKARRDKRRSNVWKMSAPQLEKCSNCGAYKRSHRLCPECGYYFFKTRPAEGVLLFRPVFFVYLIISAVHENSKLPPMSRR